MRLSRALGSVAVACLAIAPACGGDDDAASGGAGSEGLSDDGSSSGGSDDGGADPIGGGGPEGEDETGTIPDVDVCSLAADTIRGMIVEINPHLDVEPTAEQSTDTLDRPQCEWRIDTNLPMTVAVGSYDDAVFHEAALEWNDATPVAGLGDEAHMSVVMRADLSWRRDGFSVHLAGFPPDRVVAIAQEIDAQMPR